MQRFLTYIANYLLEKHGDHLHRIAVVFPNRRAGLWFQHEISALASQPVWSPRIFTITSLTEYLTKKQITDTVPLVLELYHIWREVLQEKGKEPLDSFYRWGEMLLGDFDDMDKYLVNAGDLFRNLKALKNIEVSYLNDEQKKLIRQFWDHFPEGEGSPESRSFISLWEYLETIYAKYNLRLREKDMAYEGMLYRQLAEKETVSLDPWEKIIFAGFHALTPAEVRLFAVCKQEGKALFFWDYDEAYLKDTEIKSVAGRDAGYFIRAYKKMFPPPEEAGIFSNLMNKDKRVEVYAAPTRNAQAYVAKQLLDKWSKEPSFNAERTALVLADEQLLLPVVHAIPEEIPDINITMGFPVAQTPVFGLFSLMMELHIHALRESGKVRFHTSRMVEIIDHPLFGDALSREWQHWTQEIRKKNVLWVYSNILPKDDVLHPLLSLHEEAPGLAQALLDILYQVVVPSEEEAQEELPDIGFNREAYYQLYLLVNRLNDALESYHDVWYEPGKDIPAQDSFVLYLKLLSQMAASIKIPFYGEPLAGLQVMGLLETRLLDVDRVILFSVNEKWLPKGISAVNSFIPYNLRKGFGMPTFDHHDTVYNYYFLRLLQRSRDIALVYSIDTEGGETGEISRFVYQLDYLFGIPLIRKKLSFNPEVEDTPPRIVEKDRNMVEKLYNLLQSGISPSALNMYMDCSLRFYLRYLAGIKEPDEVTEEIDQATMGILFHKAMEAFYKPLVGKKVSAEQLQTIARNEDRILKTIDTAFLEVFPEQGSQNGRNNVGLHGILKYAVLKFIRHTLEMDSKEVPYTVAGLEKKVQRSLRVEMNDKKVQVVLSGMIDRLDDHGDKVYLIDYKTGTVNNGFKGLASLFDPDNEKRNHAVFQIMLYAWMIAAHETRTLAPRLYFLKNMFTREPDPRIFDEKVGVDDFSPYSQEFEWRLRNLLGEMMNAEIPFRQTKNEKLCDYCPYAAICHSRG